MTKYRIKTQEEFEANGSWEITSFGGYPKGWNNCGTMNKYLGIDVDDAQINSIEKGYTVKIDGWSFQKSNFTLNEVIIPEEPIEDILKQIKENNSLINKPKTMKAVKEVNPVTEKFVFMDKTVNVLNVGYSTCKNVVLYGPGE